MKINETIAQNKNSWDAIADDWFGTTALPIYGKKTPSEETLQLFGNMAGAKVLDIGCGSGHSLKYLSEQGAKELWGLDLSTRQIENAEGLLKGIGLTPKLFNAPMEVNPGLPLGYFDAVYSIYALGWTQDLDTTIELVASYLKPNGIFIFSWDHPLMSCVTEIDGQLTFDSPYHEEDIFNFTKADQPMTVINRKMSTYINTLSKHGIFVEQLIEAVDTSENSEELAFSSAYYSEVKAQKIPLSFIIKARKIGEKND